MIVVGSLVACSGSGSGPTIVDSGIDTLDPNARVVVDGWTTQAPMPVGRANHCIAKLGTNKVAVIGGNRKVGGSFVKTAEIHVADVSPDGSVGAWTVAGTMPSPVTECTATSEGNRLYVIDGIFDDTTHGGQIWTAELGTNGQLSTMTSLGALGQRMLNTEAIVRGGELTIMDTKVSMEGDATVTARTRVDGPLSFREDDWAIGFRGQAQYAFLDGFMVVMGGYTGEAGNPVTDQVYVAADPFAGAMARPPLPMATSHGEALALGHTVLLIGGRAAIFDAVPRDTVYASRVGPDGSMGDWVVLPSLPQIRSHHECAAVGLVVVCTGGAGAASADDAVFTAPVRFEI